MFANVFFLFLILVIIASAPEGTSAALLADNSVLALGVCLLLYLGLLALIYAQNYFLWRRVDPERLLFLANLEFTAFFLCSYFVFGAQRLFQAAILAPFNTTLLTLFSLFLYFAGLFFFHYTSNLRTWGKSLSLSRSWLAVCFLLPFALPFLVLILAGDVSTFIPYESFKSTLGIDAYAWTDPVLSIALSIVALLATMLLLPPMLVFIWRCSRLNNPSLVARLEALCQKAHFKHAGFRIWAVMEGSFNAAIIGIIGRFRYILFTPKLLNRLSPNAIEAILSHEMGHSRYRHLLIYPLILFGMLVAAWLSTSLVYTSLMQDPQAKAWQAAWPLWKELVPLVLLLVFAAVCAAYFRLVFGYFSRLFERQADLYVFELNVPAQHMVEALNEIGHAAGGIHETPNWHHYSIQQRIDFLTSAEQNHSLIANHHRKVIYSLAIYLIALGLATILLGKLSFF